VIGLLARRRDRTAPEPQPDATAPQPDAAAPQADPAAQQAELSAPAGAVSDSMSVAVWTIVSRVTGVLRGIAVAAVLGATYFANTYQFTNSLPNLIFYGLLAGSLFSSLLVPALVRHIDVGDRQSAARVAGGLLGVALLGTLAMVPLAALLTPVLLHLGSMDAASPSAAHSQAAVGTILVLLLLPQVPLYAVVGTSTAVMNAHRRFALAAAAPALENVGTIAVLGIVYLEFASAAQKGTVPMSLILLLGAGSTAAVLLHASVQWWGARRVGVTLRPRAGWREPLVREVIKRAGPAGCQAALVALQMLALLVVADRIAGGVVAFQIAVNFYFLPIAVGATPVALSLVPRLARMTGKGQAVEFRDTYHRGRAFAIFLIVPASVAYYVLAQPLASAIAYGRFGNPGSVHLVAAALTGLAVGILGETLFMVATYACYARHDTKYPLRGMLIQTVVCAAGIAISIHLHGLALLTGLGLSLAAGALCAACYLQLHLRRELPRGGERILPTLVRAAIASALMGAGAWATARLVTHLLDAKGARLAAMLAATVVGLALYLAFQALMRAPEVAWIGAALRGRLNWTAATNTGATTTGATTTGATTTGATTTGERAAMTDGTSSPAGPGRLIAGLGARLRQFLGDRAVTPKRLRLNLALLAACAGFGALAAVSFKYALIALVLTGLSTWVLVKPQVAAYLLILLTPLVVGLNAGIPLLRPNEVLIVLFGLLIAARWVARVRTGERMWPKLDKVDLSLLALALTSSVLPLLMMMARQRPITSDDLLYCIVIWKLMAEYVIVRSTIKTREQAMRCLWLSLISAAIVCVIGIVQSLGLFGIPVLLGKYYSPLGTTSALTVGRGSSLLSLPAAVADLAILNLAIVVAMIGRARSGRKWLAGLAVLYALGVLAAAEFSTLLALLPAFFVLVALTRLRKLLAYAIPVTIIGAAVLWPVIQIRLSGFQSASGIPISWQTRLTNLHTYFWPQLFSDYNWILGVRPSARVAVPTQIYGYVWIESGYTWLLWGGGIPLLGSYIAFAVFALKKCWRRARLPGPEGIAATAIAAATAAQLASMVFDPHLTYRGSGDAFFMILALVRCLPSRKQQDRDSTPRRAVTAPTTPRPAPTAPRPPALPAPGPAPAPLAPFPDGGTPRRLPEIPAPERQEVPA
jgi:murein biosynthesis integral membrane protein MurJ